MPVEDPIKVDFPPRNYYYDCDQLDELAIFVVEESLASYIREFSNMPKDEFNKVYEDFDFMAIWYYGHWLSSGYESQRMRELKETYERITSA